MVKGRRDYAKLTKKVVTDKRGHRKTVWVKIGDAPKKISPKKEAITPDKKSKPRKTGIDEVDKVLSEHGAHSKTPNVALMQLTKLRDNLSKKVDKLAGGTATSPLVRLKLKKYGNALGEVKRHIASIEKRKN